MLWTRTIGSTIIGEGLDSLFFISIAFIGAFALTNLLVLILTQWTIKSLYEIIATPLTYAVVGFLKKKEKLDSYDYKANYNPFTGLLQNKPITHFYISCFVREKLFTPKSIKLC